MGGEGILRVVVKKQNPIKEEGFMLYAFIGIVVLVGIVSGVFLNDKV